MAACRGHAEKEENRHSQKELIRAALSLIVCLIHRISPFHWTRFPALPERSAKD
jgi:hypothetical protein